MGIADKMDGLFKRDFENKKEAARTIMLMLKVLTEGKQETLRELLFMCMPYFGDGQVSVLKSDSRALVATTYETPFYERIQNVALYIRDVGRKSHYLREEDNGMFFPKGKDCIRVYPLKEMGGESCFLMVEQEKNEDLSTDRMIDVISIATRIHLQEINSYLAMKTDRLTGLGNRDALIEHLMQTDTSRECYLSLYSIQNIRQMADKEGMTKAESLVCKAAELLEGKCKGNVFRVRDGALCVCIYGKLYDVMSLLQDCLDEITNIDMQMKISCVVVRIADEPYKLLYLCEKEIDKENGDAVIFVREKEVSMDISEEEKLFFLGVKPIEHEEPDKEYFYEEYEKADEEEPERTEEGFGFDFEGEFLNWDKFGEL